MASHVPTPLCPWGESLHQDLLVARPEPVKGLVSPRSLAPFGAGLPILPAGSTGRWIYGRGVGEQAHTPDHCCLDTSLLALSLLTASRQPIGLERPGGPSGICPLHRRPRLTSLGGATEHQQGVLPRVRQIAPSPPSSQAVAHGLDTRAGLERGLVVLLPLSACSPARSVGRRFLCPA